MTFPADQRAARWWQWPTILSLDAPVVALVWQEELTRASLSQVRWHHRFLLAVVVWLIYVADRWIEGLRLDPDQVRTPRHWFYMRHRRAMVAVSVPILLIATAVAAVRLDAREWWAGLAVAAAVLVYLLSHQHLHRDSPWRAPKETCVAALFAVGCALSPSLQPGAHTAALAGLATLFGLLCFTNCALISAWEEDIDRCHGQTSLALQFSYGRRLSRHLAWLGTGAGIAAAIVPTVGPMREGAVCMAVSSALLALLDHAQPRIGTHAARVLADAALLTPPLAWMTLRVIPALGG